MREQIKTLFEEIRDILHKAGVARTATTYSAKKLEAADEKELQHALKWLTIFKEAHADSITRALNLVPADVWQRYKLLEITGLQEQKILNKAVVLAREEWKFRPGILQKGRRHVVRGGSQKTQKRPQRTK